MAIHSIGFGVFFINSSKKIPLRHASIVLKYTGIANILFNFLIVAGCYIIVTNISESVICRDCFKRGHLLGLDRNNKSVTTTLLCNYNYS